MFTLAVLVATLLLITPGFLAGATFSFVLGYRSRDFNTSVVWSLVWSFAGYALVALLHLVWLKAWTAPDALFGLALDGTSLGSGTSTPSLPGTLTPTLPGKALSLGEVGELALAGAVCSTLLALGLAKALRVTQIRGLVKNLLGRPFTPDVWNEYFETRAPGLSGKPVNVTVLLQDGAIYMGILENPSDIQSARGLILRDVTLIPAPSEEEKDAPFYERALLKLGRPKDKLLLMGEIVSVQITDPEEALDQADANSELRGPEEDLLDPVEGNPVTGNGEMSADLPSPEP